MKKSAKSLTGLSYIILFLLNCNLYGSSLAKSSSIYSSERVNEELVYFSEFKRLAPPPEPVVNSPIYLCQGSSASPLTATALSGHTLIWYGTNATGGTQSSTAPTPSTSSVGSTTYYVSQTDGVDESPRASIVVNVVADTGGAILNLRCDPSQILPADRDSSVFFDWSNNPLNPINHYTYTYTIQGGAPVSGTSGPSNLQVFGMQPGQSATLTLSYTFYPCAPTETITCTVPCGTATVTPDFPAIPPICTGSPAPILQPTSPNGISGTWSPAVVSNTASDSYVFTPDPVLFPCATTQTLNVTVLPLADPVFSGIPSTVCQGATPPILPTSSNNAPPFTGTWAPSVVNTSVLGPTTYTFNPDPGQCVSMTPTTVTITVIPNNVTPTFTQVGPICSGDALTALPTTSNEGITGGWSPVLNNTTTTTYTFTPDPNQCALSTTMTITVNPNVNPTFAAVGPICSGDPLAPLPTTSDNGYSGSWSPAIDNTKTTTYTFTPNPNQCALSATMTITVNPIVNPTFAQVGPICSGDTLAALPTTSNEGITGGWSPVLNNTATTTYTFTPNPNQCALSTTMTITVNPIVDPTFTQVGPICSGDALTALPTTSNEGITGGWSPVLNNTATTTYTFTPNPNQCALSTTMTITVNPKDNPTFAAVEPICSGDPLAPLPTTSDNGYSGSWSPAIDNTKTTTYTFTPNAGQCANLVNLTITVNPVINPVFNAIPSVVCENSGNFILPIASNNSPAITGTWSPSFVDSAVLGTVNYVFTPDAGQCASATAMDITVKPSNSLIDFQWTVTEAFSENQVITISAIQPGDYLYQLDSGPFQTSPVFENVSYGEHTVTVSDPDGCNVPLTKGEIFVVDYPKFFTPNGDGQNDTWNIDSLNNVNAKIFVFDRYGKLLKEIRPNNAGWNGSYNGKPMPANDYWFVIYYEEGNAAKNFRSHFSLKR